MASSQQIRERTLAAFKLWAASQSHTDFKQIIHRGQLHRGAMAKAIGCGTSAFTQKGKKPGLPEELEKLEDLLRTKGVLPRKTEKAKKEESEPKEYDNTKRSRIRDSNRLNELEVENQNLNTQVAQLQTKLARLAELSEVLADFGVAPSE
jgi:hypothetical protein